LYFIFVGVDCALILFTGYVLIDSVIRIRQALRDRKGDANLKQMAIHAAAFGLFVVAFIGARAVLILTCFNSKFNICGDKPECVCVIDASNANLLYKTVMGALDIASFISQTLLCWILWDLGTAFKEDTIPPEASEICLSIEIRTESFDSEAEMQAKIWNMFARPRNNSVVFEEGRTEELASSKTTSVLTASTKSGALTSFTNTLSTVNSRTIEEETKTLLIIP
jgi:hypothetical protein